MAHPLMNQPVGVTRSGRVIYPIAGGSDGVQTQDPPEQPAAPPAQPDQQQQQPSQQQQQQSHHAQEQPRDPQGRFAGVPADVLEAVRREEREKLHTKLNRVDELAEEIKTLREEREAARRAEEEAAEAAEAARRQAEREGIDPRFAEELGRVERDWEERFNAERAAREREQAVFAKERELQQVEAYRNQAIQKHAQEIDPRFHEYITGTSPEEIDASVQRAVQKTQEIFAEIQQATQQGRSAAPGVTPTAPPMGPLEMQGAQREISAEEIKNMSYTDWLKVRDQFIPRGAGGGLYQ